MGTLVTLEVGAITISWGKNEYFPDHSALFTEAERRRIGMQDDNASDGVGVLSTTLRSVVPRLELLGWTISACAKVWKHLAESDDFVSDHAISFETFLEAIKGIEACKAIQELDATSNPQAYLVRAILEGDRPESFSAEDYWSFEESIRITSPEMLLRLIAENDRNLDARVRWCYADHVDAGWSSEEDHRAGPRRDFNFTIVTEGTTDTAILQKSLGLISPDIAAFFRFIDMKEHYPFTGTGNLANFVKGLTKIDHAGRIVALFDNDCAGRVGFEIARSVSPPTNIAVMTLPILATARSFRAVGPSGEHYADVNGRAVSIEMFLDLATGVDRGLPMALSSRMLRRRARHVIGIERGGSAPGSWRIPSRIRRGRVVSRLATPGANRYCS